MEVLSSSATSHLDHFKFPAAVDTLIYTLMSEPTQNQVCLVRASPNRVASAFRLPAERE